jgi:hypothetical protein
MHMIEGDREMKKFLRLFLFGGMILVLLTAACTAEETTPTLVGTSVSGDATSTPFGAATEVSGTAETETAATGTAETAVETPTVGATDTAAVSTSTTQTAGTGTPGVPVTGLDIVLVECQFCVDTTAHALLVLPDTATFEIVSPPPATTTSTTSVASTSPICNTVEVNNGRQVVLCSGPEMTPLTINICTDATTCTDFPVDLLACPLAAQPTAAAPSNTPEAGAEATNTPGAGSASATPTIAISTATP